MRQLGVLLIIVAAALCLVDGSRAEAPTRVALVIANAQYGSAGVLPNPPNDAKVIEASLKAAGFTTVVVKNDLSMPEFQTALRDFQTVAASAQVALVYYAGHGIEGRGRNWLIPVSAKLQSEAHLEYEAISLDSVLGAVDRAQLRIVLLDACRNNPFDDTWTGSDRALNFGLQRVEPDLDGTLIIYAAAAGKVAADGRAGTNSPFATALARRLKEPGLPLLTLGAAVRDDVLEVTPTQRPFVYSSLSARPFYLVPGAVDQPSPMSARDRDIAFFATAREIGTIPALENYLRLYPLGEGAMLARGLLASRYRTEVVARSSAPDQIRQFKLFFDWDRFNLSPEAQLVAQAAAAYAKAQPRGATILVRTVSDGEAPDNYSMAMSDRRAGAVVALLRAEGIAQERIVPVGLGRSTMSGVRSPMDRRTDIEVVPF